ncbi:hypothetical protein BKA65DRAFT_488059 [Rhexocercosporidium sp. MPI-PUGE-AT-0058]|nr:hypothetical protein BKA65DRAFT_488059 [Rhexocercosporidium sp. MPI-PUGE-AT-0058]
MATENKPKNQQADAKSASKDLRKREVKGKIQKATTNIEGSRKTLAAKKLKLAQLSEYNRNGADPDEKAEYNNLKEQIAKLDGEVMEWEGELENLNKEDKDTDIEPQANGDDEGLFVPPREPSASSNKPNRTPLVDLTEPNGTSKPLINGEPSDDEEAVFTPAQAREATGQSHGGKIVAWRQQNRSKSVIVRYGPQNAAKYERSTAAKEDNDFDEEETEEFGPDHRLGDQKVAKKFVRRRRELLGIAGLAYNCDLKDLEPREKGESRRVAPLEIWVKWEISGREAKDRSPTLVPNSRLSPTPEPSQSKIKTEGEDSGSLLTSSTASLKASNRAVMLQYREQWYDLKGIDSDSIEPAAEGMFLKAWNEIKGSL